MPLLARRRIKEEGKEGRRRGRRRLRQAVVFSIESSFVP
jgi:hypothetical protein